MQNDIYEVIHYTEDNRDIFDIWMRELQDAKGSAAIDRAVLRLSFGNFGKNHYCRDGVWELIIDTGPGYRVYYAMAGKKIIILLCAGSKRTQQKDISRAVNYLKKYKEV